MEKTWLVEDGHRAVEARLKAFKECKQLAEAEAEAASAKEGLERVQKLQAQIQEEALKQYRQSEEYREAAKEAPACTSRRVLIISEGASIERVSRQTTPTSFSMQTKPFSSTV
ncbi:hypothetical protein NE237_030784 [Protea cynaroides]|uniref:Uncharacterized protein n=1 Tax=Protea cynaroides TaxID=273540 RepID=A0A9Q0GXU9_9MAGN|nr:hypothetical protein NE237_030784 [Protea cynaroides]